MQSPTRWGRRADDLPFYPLDCKNCERDVMLPACSSDADCPDGGTCGTIWAATAGAGGARRKVCFGHSDALVLPVHDLVAGARRSVDIAALQPAPDTRFLAALRAALNELAASGRPVTVRLIIGQYPPDGVDAAALLSALTSELRDIPGARLTVSVAAMRSCTAFENCKSFSWTARQVHRHRRPRGAGRRPQSLVRGLSRSTIRCTTSRCWCAARPRPAPSRFADRLWQFVCANLDKKPSVQLASFASGQSMASGVCPASLAPPVAARQRLAACRSWRSGGWAPASPRTSPTRASSRATSMFGAARHTIRVSQQDLGFTLGRSDTIFPESTLDRLIDFIEQRDGQVYIVLSNTGSIGNSGSTYYNDVSLRAFARHLRDMVQKRFDARDPKERYEIRKGPDPVNALLCSHVHLAPFRFGPDATWPGGMTIANHAKLWMVDDRVFYIGSDNHLSGEPAGVRLHRRRPQGAAELLDAYWNPLWQWSQRAAVSGDGVEPCIFRAPFK